MLQMPTGAAAQSVFNPATGQQELPPLSTNSLALNNGAPAPNAGTANSMADPSIAFGNSLTQMLQNYQKLGTHAAAQLQTGQLNYSDAGLKASNAQLTSHDLQGYNPQTIMNAGQSAQQPFVTGAEGLRQTGQTFNEQLGNFGDALGNAKTLMQEHQAQLDKSKANAQAIIQLAMSAGPESIQSLIKNQPDLVKLSGLDLATLETIASSSALKPKLDTNVIESNGRQLLVNTQTGETIKDLGKAYHAASGSGSSVTERLLSSQQNIINSARNELDTQRTGSADTYGNPSTYRNYLSQFIAAGGNPSDFYGALDVEQYISPPNRKGNLSGGATQVKQTTDVNNQAELQTLLDKSNGGKDLSKLNFQEKIRLQQLISG